MYLDSYGLPIQKNGDANDQLQRIAMVGIGLQLGGDATQVTGVLDPELALRLLQPTDDGVYTRHMKGSTSNVSADQLISALAFWVCKGSWPQVYFMLRACILRCGFAQNYKDGLNDSQKTKVPDFMFLRALPLFTRISTWFYPVALLADLLLVLQALSAIGPVWKDGALLPSKRTPDMVDDNLIILTLATCRYRMPTPFSRLALKLYAKLRPWNYGCVKGATYPVHIRPDPMYEALGDDLGTYYKPPYGALRWYHRVEAGGNPELALLWKPICDKWFT